MVESKVSNIGFGLFAKGSFNKGDTITELKGQIIGEVDEENENYIDFGDDEVFYPDIPYRHVNHSCEPNCEFWVEEDEDVGSKKIFLEAIKPISKGEELFTDYSWSHDVAIPCECKTDKCRGWIVHPEEIHLIPSLSTN